jgi:uncharacterized protein YhbP (UPF0306 family)
MSPQVPPEVLDYLGEKKTLTLATSGGDGPWAATLTYVNDGPDLFIWTKPGSNTARHIDENSTVAFAIDDYSDDFKQTKGIQGRGEASVVEGEDIARAADLFGQKYPQLRPGSTSMVMFFRIRPGELEFIDNSRSPDDGDEFGADFRRQSVLDMPSVDDS